MTSHSSLTVSRRLLWGLANLCAIPITWAQAQQARGLQKADQLYLVASSPVDLGPIPPTFLYKVGADHHLDLLRTLVPGGTGIPSIVPGVDALFIISNSQSPTTVSVLHYDDPRRADDISLSAQRSGSIDTLELATSRLSNGSEALLLPIFTDPTGSASPIPSALLSVAGTVGDAGNRVTMNHWNDFENIRFQGIPGGGLGLGLPEAKLSAGGIVLWRIGDFVQHPVRLGSAPPEFSKEQQGSPISLIASNDRYFAVCHDPLAEPIQSRSPDTPLMIYIQNRAQNVWQTFRTRGVTGVRLFGDWLTVNVTEWKGTRTASPGTESERAVATDKMPSIRALFEANVDPVFYTPGVLVLYSVADGRTLTIKTNHQDSEIIAVREGAVIYRTDDAIYEAAIAGNSLSNTRLLVRDDKVPEIHWAFWSKTN